MIELGYTLTDCYIANANYGDQQKQYVLKIEKKIVNVLIGGYVNEPADSDRSMKYHKIAEISLEDNLALTGISRFYKPIDWHEKPIDYRQLCKKKLKKIREAESKYLGAISPICSEYNEKLTKITITRIKRVLKKYLDPKDYKDCHKYLYIF